MKMFSGNFILAALATALTGIVLSSCTDGKSGTAPIAKFDQPIPVKVMELQNTRQSQTILASGKITTDNETIHAFKVGGVIQNLLVKEGDEVRKGQLLAILDQTEISALVEQARLELQKATRDYNRVEKLFADSVVTLEQLENSKTALDLSRERLKNAEFNKQHSRIIASQPGFVLKKFVNAGQVVGVGDPVIMTNGTEGRNWVLKVSATDQQWSMISVGDVAEVQTDAFHGKKFGAKVTRKSESSDPATGTFNIELTLDASNERFATGMFASATIQTKKSTSGWNIPYESLLDANGKDGFVFVTSDLKTAVKQPVTIASIDRNTVSISSGLESYKALIVSGSAYLTDHSNITIIK